MVIGWSLTIKGETWQNRLLREIRMQNSSESKFTAEYTNLGAFALHTDGARQGLLGSLEPRGMRRAGSGLLSSWAAVGPHGPWLAPALQEQLRRWSLESCFFLQHLHRRSVRPLESKIFSEAPVPDSSLWLEGPVERGQGGGTCLHLNEPGLAHLHPWLVFRGLPRRGLRVWHL